MSSTSSPAKSAKAASATAGAPQSSYQDRLRYAIDLLRQSEIEKQDLISKLSAAATPLPQRVRTIRRVITRPTHNGGTEEVEQEEEVLVEDEPGNEDEQRDEEQKVEAEVHSNGRLQREEQESKRARERQKQEAEQRERERERTGREQQQQQQVEARKAASKPSSKQTTPRGSLTSPARKPTPVTPQKDETKTTPRRPQSNSATISSSSSTASPSRLPRSTAASSTTTRTPFSTPPSNRTVSRTKASPSASSNTSSPAAAARRSVGSSSGRTKEVATLADELASVSLTQPAARSSSLPSSASSVSSDDSSILQTYIRFVLSPARLLAYRGSLPATPTRYETIEWLRVDDTAEDEDELQSIHSESLKGHEHDDELAVMINSKQLHDADMQRELCIQLWSHSNDVDAVDLNSDTAPEHDLLVQFTATVPELAQCANPDNSGEWEAKDEEEEERFQQIEEFFVSVEVVLHEMGDRREKDKRLELELAIEQERMRLLQEGRSPSPQPPPAAAASAAPAALTTPATQRTPVRARSSATPSGPPTPQRRPSLTSLTAPTLASAGLPSMLDDFHDLIVPDRVFARRLRMKAEEKRRQKKATASSTAADSSNNTSPTTRSPNNSHPSSPTHSPSSSLSASPGQSISSLVPFTPFEPTYYRVRMTVRDLPKMNFHGSCDSYFHVLLSTQRDSSPSPAVPLAGTGVLQSLYRSEVQFNQLNPRFASFVISSVRDRDRDRLITLRMINWRQRVEEGHEEVIGEVTVPLATLIPVGGGGGGGGGRVVEALTLTLLNPVREFIRMKSAMVGVCVLEFEELDASTVSVDTMPSSQLKSVRQLNDGEKRVSKRREKESERVKEKEREEERR